VPAAFAALIGASSRGRTGEGIVRARRPATLWLFEHSLSPYAREVKIVLELKGATTWSSG